MLPGSLEDLPLFTSMDVCTPLWLLPSKSAKTRLWNGWWQLDLSPFRVYHATEFDRVNLFVQNRLTRKEKTNRNHPVSGLNRAKRGAVTPHKVLPSLMFGNSARVTRVIICYHIRGQRVEAGQRWVRKDSGGARWFRDRRPSGLEAAMCQLDARSTLLLGH